MKKDSQNPTVEELQRQLAAQKESYESKLARQESEIGRLKEKVASQKEELARYNKLAVWLAAALGEIATQRKSMLTEDMQFVTDLDEPLAKQLQRLVNAVAKRMAGFARSVSRARPERKIGGESIGDSQANSNIANIDIEAQENSNTDVEVQKNSNIDVEVQKNSNTDVEVQKNSNIDIDGISNIDGRSNSSKNMEAGKNSDVNVEVQKNSNIDIDDLNNSNIDIDGISNIDDLNNSSKDIDEEIDIDIEGMAETGAKPVLSKPAKAISTMMGDLGAILKRKNLSDGDLEVLESNRPDRCDETEPTARGRRINMPELPRLDEPDGMAVTKCPNCGTLIEAMDDEKREHIIVDIGEMIDLVKTVRTNLMAARGGAVKLGYRAYRCGKCGTIFSGRPENADHPFCPGREISTQSVLEISYGQSLGFSINAAGRDFEKNAKLGGNTISSLMHDIDIYVMTPIWRAIMQALSRQVAIGADETPFAVKQAMGLGRMPKGGPSQLPLSSLTHFMSIGSMRRSPIRIVGYLYLTGRDSESIAGALRGLPFKCLTTDGYAGYNKALEEHPDASHQVCLVHWRRGLMDNAYDTRLVKDYIALPRKKRERIMLGQFERKGRIYLVLIILKAISYIYGHERSIDKLEEGSPKIEPIRKKQRALMDLVTKTVKKLAKTVAQEKNGTWRALSSGNPLGKSCAYYLNHENELRTFLKEGNYLVEPDNNLMEQTIRPLALIRNVSHFWTSPDYAKAALARLSVFRTLEVNGIDPLAWCCKLCGKIYDHIAVKLIDYTWKDTGNLTTKVGIRSEAKPGEEDTLPEELRKYRLSELTKDFPFEDYVNAALGIGKRATAAQLPKAIS